MKINYFSNFAPIVNVNYVVDDFGTERDLLTIRPLARYHAFTGAKIFVTGMTFEDAEFRSELLAHEEH